MNNLIHTIYFVFLQTKSNTISFELCIFFVQGKPNKCDINSHIYVIIRQMSMRKR